MRLPTLLLIFSTFLSNFCFGQTITLTPTAIKGDQANPSGLKFVNLNSSSPVSASNGKTLTVDASGNVILTLSSDATTSLWQQTGSDIINVNSGVVKVNNLQLNNSTIAVTGAIRWNGSDFEGYNGTSWVSLTQAAKITRLWVTAPTHGGNSWSTQPCTIACPSNLGYVPAADPSGYVCIGAKGAKTTVTANGNGYWCGVYESFRMDNALYQCHCVKVN